MTKSARLQDWEQQAIHDAYVAGEKVESIACEFEIHKHHVRAVAKRMGAKVRQSGRPSKQKVKTKRKSIVESSRRVLLHPR